jgi:hypothetical protein
METSRSQRWRERRALWATDSLIINPKAYSVDIIDHAVARTFIAEHHYLPSYPAAQVAVGLFGLRAVLAGVAVFAVPATDAVITRHTGFTDPAKGCVLARLILLDRVPQNGESFFCARAFRLLRQARPAIEAVVSYSDPEFGHTGRVYAALSGAHRGTTRPRTVLRAAGQTISDRTLSKIRLGLPAPGLRESPAAWLARLQAEQLLTRHRQSGLFTYCFELTRNARRQGRALPRLPYPKLLPGP